MILNKTLTMVSNLVLWVLPLLLRPALLRSPFKDKLIGDIPGAYAQAFDFSKYIDNGMELETESEVDGLRQGVAAVRLSRDIIHHIRAPWFSLKEDHDNVLIKGPWFIREHFLSIRPWEANFRLEEANIASVAIWVRLPRLPIEYYDLEALKEIGQAIGTVLRIDTHIASKARGRYAKLCIQVDIEKPIYTIMIGKFQQSVVYKGIGKLCFSCGRFGHSSNQAEDSHVSNGEVRSSATSNAPTTDSDPRQPVSAGTSPTTDAGTLIVPDQVIEDKYGLWLVVTCRKQANKSSKRTNGNASPKAPVLPPSRAHHLVGSSLKMAHSNDGKRKAIWLESSSKALPFSFRPTKLPSQGPNLKAERNLKGNLDNPHTRAVLLPKADALSDKISPLNHASTRPCSLSSPVPFNGTFKTKWDKSREMGIKDGGSSDRNSKCSEQLSTGPNLAIDGNLVMDPQVSYPRAYGSENHIVEECAISYLLCCPCANSSQDRSHWRRGCNGNNRSR
nr:uncharacterized protein CFP56_42917 [Quercus suber]